MVLTGTVYADTSFYFAYLDPRDLSHARAVELHRHLSERNLALISSWEVIVETVTLLRNRHSYSAAITFIHKVLPAIRVIYIDDKVRSKGLKLFEKLARDKRLSLCDVISYLLVTEHLDHIPCLAFDDDFESLGLHLVVFE